MHVNADVNARRQRIHTDTALTTFIPTPNLPRPSSHRLSHFLFHPHPPPSSHHSFQLFDSIDRNKDGLVSSEEWGNAVGHYKDLPALMKFFGGHTVAEVGCAFAVIDVDDSKDLTWEEFIAAATSFSKDGTPLAQTVDPRDNPLWKIFTQLDTDGSGNLDKDEITAGLNALGMDTGAVRYWACLCVLCRIHSPVNACCVCAGRRPYCVRLWGEFRVWSVLHV